MGPSQMQTPEANSDAQPSVIDAPQPSRFARIAAVLGDGVVKVSKALEEKPKTPPTTLGAPDVQSVGAPLSSAPIVGVVDAPVLTTLDQTPATQDGGEIAAPTDASLSAVVETVLPNVANVSATAVVAAETPFPSPQAVSDAATAEPRAPVDTPLSDVATEASPSLPADTPTEPAESVSAPLELATQAQTQDELVVQTPDTIAAVAPEVAPETVAETSVEVQVDALPEQAPVAEPATIEPSSMAVDPAAVMAATQPIAEPKIQEVALPETLAVESVEPVASKDPSEVADVAPDVNNIGNASSAEDLIAGRESGNVATSEVVAPAVTDAVLLPTVDVIDTTKNMGIDTPPVIVGDMAVTLHESEQVLAATANPRARMPRGGVITARMPQRGEVAKGDTLVAGTQVEKPLPAQATAPKFVDSIIEKGEAVSQAFRKILRPLTPRRLIASAAATAGALVGGNALAQNAPQVYGAGAWGNNYSQSSGIMGARLVTGSININLGAANPYWPQAQIQRIVPDAQILQAMRVPGSYQVSVEASQFMQQYGMQLLGEKDGQMALYVDAKNGQVRVFGLGVDSANFTVTKNSDSTLILDNTFRSVKNGVLYMVNEVVLVSVSDGKLMTNQVSRKVTSSKRLQ